VSEDLGSAANALAWEIEKGEALPPALLSLFAPAGHFPQFLHALPVAIYTTNAEGRLTFCNKAAMELAGRRPVLGRDKWCVSWRLYRPDGTWLSHEECPMAVALKTGKPVRGAELIVERPDGTRCPVLLYPTPLFDDEGRLVVAVNTMVDVSEQRNAEARQHHLVQELSHRVKNNMQLLHALLDMAVHDSRNEEARTVLADASRRVEAMAVAQKALYDVDDATMFEAGDLLRAVCENARQAFGGGRFDRQIEILLSSAAARLSNDVAMPLALILSELLTNAVKRALADGRRDSIKVDLSNKDDCFRLMVEDGGPGFSLDETHSTSSGLGLVFGLARQLGGSVMVARTPGARCTVEFVDRHRH
jgi:PAS domain S-box-containing protein